MDRTGNKTIPSCFICKLDFIARQQQLSDYKKSRKPLVLACGHSVCEACIIKEIKLPGDSLECNYCNTTIIASSSYNIEKPQLEFPVNNFLLGLSLVNSWNSSDTQISFAKPRQNKPSLHRIVKCNECVEKKAEFSCVQCIAPYCSYCFSKVHQSARAFRDHVKADLNTCIEAVIDVNCPVHPDQKKQFWCEKCSVAACSRCLLASHMDHNPSVLVAQNSNCFQDIVRTHVKVANLQQRLKVTRKKAMTGLHKAESSEIMEAEKDILHHFSRLHGLLQVKENELLKELYTPYNGAANTIKALLQQIDNTMLEMEEVISVSRRIIQDDQKYAEHACYPEILAKLKKYESIPCHLIVSDFSDASKLIYEEEIFDQVSKHCRLEHNTSTCKYQMVTEDELPAGYVIEPIIQVSIENLTRHSTLVSVPSVSSLPSSNSSSLVSLNSINSSNQEKEVISIKESQDEFNSYFDDLVPECSVRVVLIHAVSPSDFYVHRLGANKRLSDMEVKLSTNRGAYKKNFEIKIGSYYMVQYGQDKKWYRAKVMAHCGDYYTVFYIDYGNTENVTPDRFRLMPAPYLKMFGLAIHCSLYNCAPKGGTTWDPQALSTMLKIIGDSNVVMMVMKKGSSCLYVDLFKTDPVQGNTNIKESLLFLGYANLREPIEKVSQQVEPTMKNVPGPGVLKEGETIEGNIVDIETPSHFYCQNHKNNKTLTLLTSGLQEFYSRKNDKLFVYTPKKGMYVAAMHSKDNHWYRAKILDIPYNKMVCVQYVDYGYTETIAWKRIRHLTSKFFLTNQQSYLCSLVDICPTDRSDWSQNAIDFFKGIVFKQLDARVKFKFVVHSFAEEKYNVVMYQEEEFNSISLCINSLMVTEKFAESIGINSTVLKVPSRISESEFSSESNVSVKPVNESVKKPEIVLREVECVPKVKTEPALSEPVSRQDGVKLPANIIKIVSPSEFYITFCTMVEQLSLMKREMEAFYDKNHEDYRLTEVEEKSLCMVRRQIEGDWVRAAVLQANGKLVQVHLIDLGESVEVDIGDTYKLDGKFRALSDGAKMCHLGGIMAPFENKWPFTAIDDFKEFVEKNQGNIYISGMGPSTGISVPVEVLLKEEKVADAWEPTVVKWTSFNNSLKKRGLAQADGTVDWDVEDSYEMVKKHVIRNQRRLNELANLSQVIRPIESVMSYDEKKSVDLLKGSSLASSQCNTPDIVMPIPAPIMPKAWLPPVPFTSLEFIANITNVDDECSFFVQDFAKTVIPLKRITEELDSHCKLSVPKPYDLYWTVGQTCLCRYHLDNKWYRGTIKSINDDNVASVIFVDYGNVEDCKAADLRKIPLKTDVPVQGQFCYLRKIRSSSEAGKWPMAHLDYIHSLVVEKHCLITLEELPDGTGYVIEQVILPDGSKLLERLVIEGVAKYCDIYENHVIQEQSIGEIDELIVEKEETLEELGISSQPGTSGLDDSFVKTFDDLILQTEDSQDSSDIEVGDIYDLDPISSNNCDLEDCGVEYKFIEVPDHIDHFDIEVGIIPSPDTIIFQIVDSSDITLNDSRELFIHLMIELQECAALQPVIENPQLNMQCCAKFTIDNKWYRGIILDVPSSDQIMVQYVDYGNIEQLPIADVRELRPEWGQLEAQSVQAKLYNVKAKNSSESTLQAMTQALIGSPLTAVIKEHHPVLSVELYDSMNKLAYEDLIEKGFIISTEVE